MHGVFLEINIHEPGHAKTVVLPLQMCVARFSCLLQQAFVTVLVFTISEQYEYSDSLKDQTRLKAVKSGRRLLFVSKNILIKNY